MDVPWYSNAAGLVGNGWVGDMTSSSRSVQAIRPAVVTRKVCGGNRTRHGANTQQVLASVVRTAHQRHLDLTPLIVAMLRSPRPTVLDAPRRPPRRNNRAGLPKLKQRG